MEIREALDEKDIKTYVYALCKAISTQQKQILDILAAEFPEMYQENREVLSRNIVTLDGTTRRVKKIRDLKTISTQPTVENMHKIEDWVAKELLDPWLFGKLKFYLRKFAENEEDLNDIVWEAILKIYEVRHQYDKSKWTPKTWIYKIAHNHAVDQVRKTWWLIQQKYNHKNSYNKQTESEWLDTLITKNMNAEDNEQMDPARKKIFFQKINKILEELEPYEKSLLLSLAKWEKYEEIAERLELPLWTIKGQIFRAREKMRPSLIEAKKILEE